LKYKSRLLKGEFKAEDEGADCLKNNCRIVKPAIDGEKRERNFNS